MFLLACGGGGSSSSSAQDGETGTATDASGNSFSTVVIDGQTWMSENLATSKFSNGDEVMHATSWEQWQQAGANQQPAWCYYDFNDANAKYGKLYNWYAVTDERGLAPEGWKVPSNSDWSALASHLGDDTAGKAMKSTEGWENNGNGTNSSGFNALPAGAMNPSAMNINSATYWWTTNEKDANSATTRFLGYWGDTLDEGAYGKENGFSVRCVKD